MLNAYKAQIGSHTIALGLEMLPNLKGSHLKKKKS